jgi:hypothetical protein
MAKLAGDHVKVLVDGYELTGDHNRIAINDSRASLDGTAFGDAVQNFIPGRRTMSLSHKGFMNPETGRSHPVLNSAALEGVVSILLGQNADPAVGDPTYSLLSRQAQYQNAPQVGQVIPFMAQFNSQGQRGDWGVALAVPVTITNTTTGSGVDLEDVTSKGGAAYLHILQAASSDSYVIIVEGSTVSNFSSGVTTLATFNLNGQQLGSERIAIPASTPIPRYVRYKATRTGSGEPVTLAVSLVRFE